MPIKRTENGGWDISVSVGGRRLHRSLPPGTPARDAKSLEADLRTALKAGAPSKIPGDPSMLAVMALYLAETEHLRSPETARHHANRIGPWLEQFRASQARACAAKVVKDMRGAYAPATINRSLGALKRGLQLAWESGATTVNYADHVERLPENNERTTYLTMEQVHDLAECASENVRAAIWIALLTGCRRGEVCKIRPEHIRGDYIELPAGNTKTLRYRRVQITPPLRPWLKYLPLPINYEGVKSGFRRAREKAGMPHVHFHDLRHSCATILLGLGVRLDVVRDVLGHTSIKSTERYAHAIADHQRDALTLLGNLHSAVHKTASDDHPVAGREAA